LVATFGDVSTMDIVCVFM